jgi:hypothetical protein
MTEAKEDIAYAFGEFTEGRYTVTALRDFMHGVVQNALGDAPCEHFAEIIGRVDSGNLRERGSCGATTCADCIVETEGWVQFRTGRRAHFYLYDNAEVHEVLTALAQEGRS